MDNRIHRFPTVPEIIQARTAEQVEYLRAKADERVGK